jgi:hypothetical protein
MWANADLYFNPQKLNRPVLEGQWNNREVDSIGV